MQSAYCTFFLSFFQRYDAKIIYLAMFPESAKRILCEVRQTAPRSDIYKKIHLFALVSTFYLSKSNVLAENLNFFFSVHFRLTNVT